MGEVVFYPPRLLSARRLSLRYDGIISENTTVCNDFGYNMRVCAARAVGARRGEQSDRNVFFKGDK